MDSAADDLTMLKLNFMANLLHAAGVTLREVHVNKLADDIFYATAVIEGPAGSHMVDARSSDALNLAVLTGAPIRVAPEVIDAAGVIVQKQAIQDESGQDVIEQTIRRQEKKKGGTYPEHQQGIGGQDG